MWHEDMHRHVMFCPPKMILGDRQGQRRSFLFYPVLFASLELSRFTVRPWNNMSVPFPLVLFLLYFTQRQPSPNVLRAVSGCQHAVAFSLISGQSSFRRRARAALEGDGGLHQGLMVDCKHMENLLIFFFCFFHFFDTCCPFACFTGWWWWCHCFYLLMLYLCLDSHINSHNADCV